MKFTSEIPVTLEACNASDAMVVAAARVSTMGDESSSPEKVEEHTGLINFLAKNRHGSPFEHNSFTFKVRAPIFVWREHMRHRIGFSYNEESGRYKQLEADFYLPGPERKLAQVGKPGHYEFVDGTSYQHHMVNGEFQVACTQAYQAYGRMLVMGVTREVARMVLPVNIFSTAFVTCNARSLMNFLSLRTKHEDSMFPSFPQREIEMVAEQYEQHFAAAMPLTYAAFVKNGRVSP